MTERIDDFRRLMIVADGILSRRRLFETERGDQVIQRNRPHTGGEDLLQDVEGLGSLLRRLGEMNLGNFKVVQRDQAGVAIHPAVGGKPRHAERFGFLVIIALLYFGVLSPVAQFIEGLNYQGISLVIPIR